MTPATLRPLIEIRKTHASLVLLCAVFGKDGQGDRWVSFNHHNIFFFFSTSIPPSAEASFAYDRDAGLSTSEKEVWGLDWLQQNTKSCST